MVMSAGRLSSLTYPATPEPPVPPAACYKRTAGLGPPSITEPFDADGRKMNSWYAKLSDWQIGVTWLVVTAFADVIYFVPLVRLLAPFAH
jgi:hypothetical protein